MRNGTLILNVIHGKEMEIEYEKNEIIDKINSFFGYDCIDKVVLRIVEDKIYSQKKKVQNIRNLEKIEKKLKNIQNEQLKSSLNNLVKAYNEKNE